MSIPADRQQFKQYILGRLGQGAIQINVLDSQVEDRIDYALKKFADYHFDGTQHNYIAHQITSDDQTNGFFTVPSGVLDVVGIFDTTSELLGGSIFNLKYQFALTNFQNLFRMIDLSNYVIVIQNLQFLEEILVGKTPIRFNRYDQVLHVDCDWTVFNVGDFLILDCYTVLDPNTYTLAWGDPWLIQYATAQVKQQWGANTKKFGNVPTLGGLTFTGQQTYDEASAEIDKLEASLINDWSLPALDMIG
jgi:hypothetical protein